MAPVAARDLEDPLGVLGVNLVGERHEALDRGFVQGLLVSGGKLIPEFGILGFLYYWLELLYLLH